LNISEKVLILFLTQPVHEGLAGILWEKGVYGRNL